VVGLTARADLNGVCAKLGKWHDDKGRWETHCKSGIVLVKSTNLQVLGDAPDELVLKALLAVDTLAVCLATLSIRELTVCSAVCAAFHVRPHLVHLSPR
jgi:hypothetical protein